MLTHLGKINRMALDFLFPPRCINCGQEGNYICADCLQTAPCIKPPVCPVCILPITGNRRCDCRFWQSLDRLSAPYLFQGAIRKAVIEFKFHNLRAIAPFFARLLERHLSTRPVSCDLLVPVPLHKKRFRQRGYNQSLLLAKELGKLTGLRLAANLTRNRYSPSQVDSENARQRRVNVTGVFTWSSQTLTGEKILLIDDVATTGATLDACASALKKAGASTVQALTLAREN
ncbi:MAG: ComF family protein [Dehalococcoidales bacterium]|jgi:ComF family protein|nr:ComF family protein [Dehalococcoidales bacterium]MDD3264424.1 ComF family protein [Dehalococcoidales bacterium]MDD4321965.1 ComF family protein [Dehalococcoidales bacterium]MDD4794050.1 ComF family protein [Dehalococcoidales bacterium]MDD5122243.1 ComF family protein [Dehalococcoidales bacterium]